MVCYITEGQLCFTITNIYMYLLQFLMRLYSKPIFTPIWRSIGVNFGPCAQDVTGRETHCKIMRETGWAGAALRGEQGRTEAR